MSGFVSRFGVLAQKIGMSRILTNDSAIAVTILKVPKCHVVARRDAPDYVSLALGVEEAKFSVAKPQAESFKKKGLPVCSLVREFRVKHEEAKNVGEAITIDLLEEGLLVDVTAESVGKGFAGPMKRWNFSGMGASHGVSLTHRAHGSLGTRDKIFPGRKMAGHLGCDVITIQSQKIVKIDNELGLIAIYGTVPGKSGVWVRVSKAMKGKK
jgi:large subunit ribosomal protein L3